MSNNYLLKMIPENDCVKAYLNEIKEHYKNMKGESIYFLIDSSLSVNKDFNQYNKTLTEIDELLNKQNEHINELIILNNKISKKLISFCNHNWFIDHIDIDPDRSKQIEYCKNCGISKT